MEDVNSSIENIDEVTRLLRISVPPASVQSTYSNTLSDYTRKAVIKGFRPGKAPASLIESMHGEALKAEVTERLVSNSFRQAVKQHSLEVVGSPQVEGANLEMGKPFSFTVRVSIFPRPEVTGYDAFEVKASKRTPTDADVDQVIERMRSAKAQTAPLQFRNTAQKGDVCDLLIKSDVEGEETGPAEPVTVEIGQNQLAPELEEGIPGMEVGETKTISGTVAENHREQKLRGKAVTYTVTLTKLSEKVLPEVNDEFAKSLELQVGTVLELRMKVRESLDQESERQASVDAEAKILEQLVERNSFEVPQALVDEEIRALVQSSGLIDPKRIDVRNLNVEPFREGLTDIAKKRIRSAILVDRIAEKEGIKADETEINNRVTERAEEYGVSPSEFLQYLRSTDRLSSIGLEVTRNKVMKFLMDRAKIEYVEPAPEEQAAEGGAVA